MRCGLLGRKLSHSHSPAVHARLSDYSYELFECEPEDVEAFLKDGAWDGLNVTIPYKKTAFALCDNVSEEAKRTGSVNTIVRMADGKLYGDNTDVYGFSCMLQKLFPDAGKDSADEKMAAASAGGGKKALIFGNGGAAPSVKTALTRFGFTPVVISRRGEDNYENLARHSDAAVLVNATPVGMYPHPGVSVADIGLFPQAEAVLDLVYNPAQTAFLMQAAERGIPYLSGLLMLVAQAKKSAELFSGKDIPDERIDEITTELSRELENIVLIGMPGCGKTTIGKRLAEKLSRPFFDADKVLEEKAKKTIPEIFEKEGEDAFRRYETDVLAELGMHTGCVIATGGGCVTRKENLPHLKQNGKIVWLQRDICELETDGRPLSQAGSLQAMYEMRKPMYEAFADVAMEAGEQTAEEIMTWYVSSNALV